MINTDNKEKKQAGASEKLMYFFKGLFYSVLLFTFIGLFYYCSIDHNPPMTYDNPVYLDDWTITIPDGTVVNHKGTAYRHFETDFDGVFVATTTLPDEIKDDTSFCAVIAGDVEVYVNGELRKDFKAKRDFAVPGGVVKGFYMVVPLYRDDAGAEIKIIKTGTTRKGNVIQSTMIATNSGLYNYLMSSYSVPFMMAEILLIFAIVVFIVSIAMKIIYKRRIAMMYGSLAIAVIAAWLITNSYLFPFVYRHYHIDGVVNYMLCMLIPFGLLFYLDSLQEGRYRPLIVSVSVLSFVNIFVWSILHFTGIYSFPKALIFIDIILIIQILVVMTVLIMDIIRHRIREYKYTAFGFLGFLICAIAEIFFIQVVVSLHDDIPMLIGLAILLTMSVVQQINDLRKVNDERIKAIALSEAKTNFLASMSHEIRTPINAILGMNEMILRENSDSTVAEYASSVKSSGKMLLMLVNDVLDFSKIEAGKLDIVDAEYSFANLIRDIMPMLKERADEKKLDLKVNLLRQIPDGQISDEFRIKQVLINLINNAIKYTDSGSVILMVDGEYTDDEKYLLKMTVKDTGRGISVEGQRNLFDAFQRADLRQNGTIEGTGLGLAIVKSIIDSMKGEISVNSKLGEGSEFTVKLPIGIYDKTPVEEENLKHAPKVKKDISKIDFKAPNAKILTVDDNNSNLRIVTLFLKRAGIVPDSCDSGVKALELCKQNKYDIILLDHMMPGMDGIETLERIKNDEDSKNKETTVIVLTANAIAGSRKRYMDAGFADYLTKPLDATILEQTIKKYLPSDKVVMLDGSNNSSSVANAAYDTSSDSKKLASIKDRLTSIDGLDYDEAMKYAGYDEEILEEIVGNIARESEDKIKLMEKAFEEGNMKDFGCEAHSIKGLMAMIGLKAFSERALKLEAKANEGDMEYVQNETKDFINSYRDICNKLVGK